jgi:UDP-N-acetylmuramoylalanine--D-glutamate ligase
MLEGCIFYGECRNDLIGSWKSFVDCEVFEEFASAVRAALESTQRGDVLLLSPGCSSLDKFTSYAERGKIFMDLVQEWSQR